MTKTTSKTTESQGASSASPRAEFSAFGDELFSSYAEASKSFFEGVMALNEEVIRFANERFEASARLFQDLPACRDWQEAASLHSEFAQSETDAYRTAVPKFTEQAIRSCAVAWKSPIEPVRGFTKNAPKS